MGETSIQWTDVTWNPVRGCSVVSPGCTHCYAMKQAHRFSGAGQAYEGLTKLTNGGPVWTGKVRLVPEMLAAPLRWQKPRRVFVNSMSDLFHEDVPDEFIGRVFAVMALATRHTFQILTKRPERMRAYCTVEQREKHIINAAARIHDSMIAFGRPAPTRITAAVEAIEWPLRNVWLGISAEDQARLDERAPDLLATPSAVRFLSLEPLLGPIDLGNIDDCPEPSRMWVIVGGESGSGARHCDLAWIRSIVEQCRTAKVACFTKQLGARVYDSAYQAGVYAPEDRRTPRGPDGAGGSMAIGNLVLLRDRKGGEMDQWPADLRVREWPV